MNFNRHYELEGKHAFLSASKYHWLNYDKDRLISVYENNKAKMQGILLHQFACDAINYRICLAETEDSTLSVYVNDCIANEMTPEVVLYYSKYAFGTADAISYSQEDQLLKIYDLKTGKTPANIKQLYIYAGLFCLEYQVNPNDIKIELRIYQNNDILVCEPEPNEIWDVMDKIIAFDNILRNIDEEG